jgi:hypothetical protein
LRYSKTVLAVVVTSFLALAGTALAASVSTSTLSFKTPSGWTNVTSKLAVPDLVVAYKGKTFVSSDILVQKLKVNFTVNKSSVEKVIAAENSSQKGNIYITYLKQTKLGGFVAYQANVVYHSGGIREVQDLINYRGNLYTVDVASTSSSNAHKLADSIFSSWHWKK